MIHVRYELTAAYSITPVRKDGRTGKSLVILLWRVIRETTSPRGGMVI